jgi:hypothetical protein
MTAIDYQCSSIKRCARCVGVDGVVSGLGVDSAAVGIVVHLRKAIVVAVTWLSFFRRLGVSSESPDLALAPETMPALERARLVPNKTAPVPVMTAPLEINRIPCSFVAGKSQSSQRRAKPWKA